MTLLTIESEAQADLYEKGSKFHAFLVPISEFDARMAALRDEHRKASHHVVACRRMTETGQVEDYANDDGEPSGTAGMPALRVLIGADLVEAAVIIIRYFGGTKLGTGGLARAYAGVTARAIDAASPVPWHRIERRFLRCGFEETGALERVVAQLGLSVLERRYTETGLKVTVEGIAETFDNAQLSDWLVLESQSEI